MEVFELVVVLLLAGAALTALSRRIGAPYPAMVALGGVVLALVPGTPVLELDPELALTLFVAPVLLDAAFDASPRDLWRHWRTVSGLAIGAVALTVALVAWVAHALVPTMSWPVAITLGAIVAPSDAAAASAVLRQLRPPHHVLVILEGESLFNDASALLIYRVAVGVALAGTLTVSSVAPTFLLVTVGSAALGIVLSRVVPPVIGVIRDVGIAVIVQFCMTFACWMLAERLHLSGILTVVVFAMSTARRVGPEIPARVRLPSFAIWELAVFVLNVLAFTFVGLQLRAILERVDVPTLRTYAMVGAAVCLATIAARIVWMLLVAKLGRWRAAGASPSAGDPVALSPGAAAAVGWCGMRGIVTLAAALALPDAFPQRDLILFCSFAVVLGTLVVQGLTLRPLMGWLRLEDDGTVEKEVRFARIEMLRAAVATTNDAETNELSSLLRHRYELLLRRAEAESDMPAAERALDASIARTAIRAERDKVIAMRNDGSIGDTAYQRVEQELDFEELGLERLAPVDEE